VAVAALVEVAAAQWTQEVQVEGRADKKVMLEQEHTLVAVHKVQAVQVQEPEVLLVVQH
jgi:hypothetical protein